MWHAIFAEVTSSADLAGPRGTEHKWTYSDEQTDPTFDKQTNDCAKPIGLIRCTVPEADQSGSSRIRQDAMPPGLSAGVVERACSR